MKWFRNYIWNPNGEIDTEGEGCGLTILILVVGSTLLMMAFVAMIGDDPWEYLFDLLTWW